MDDVGIGHGLEDWELDRKKCCIVSIKKKCGVGLLGL
jgi:hypothetical protein